MLIQVPQGMNLDIREVVIEDFRAFARKSQEELVNPNIGRVALNGRFSEELGSLERRKPRAIYGGMATLGTSKITHAVRYYKESTGAKKQIVAYSTFLKLGTDADGSFANIKAGLTAGKQYNSLTSKDRIYFFNGTNTAVVYDGSNVEDIGVPTPATAPTTATGAAGVLNGNYYYKVTYQIDGYQEGNASVASALVAPVNEKVELSVIPVSANTRVTHRHLYRTEAGGAVYYYLATIADNVTTVYTDNTADGGLTTTRTAPSDYGDPDQNYKFALLHNDRIFQARGATDKSKIIYSDLRSGISYPDVYPATNYFYFRRQDGEELTGIHIDHLGQFIVLKPSSVGRINMDGITPVTWAGMEKSISSDGCIAPYSTARTPFGLLWVTSQGEGKRSLVLWDGSKTQIVYDQLSPVLSEHPATANDDLVGTYYKGVYHLARRDPNEGVAYNNRVLQIDLFRNTVHEDKKNVQCFCAWNSRDDAGELYTGSSDDSGLLQREDTQVEDVLVQTKTELEEGTFSQCEATGTEASPKLTFIQSELTDDIGATVISAATDVISGLTGDLDTIGPSCTYTSKIYEVNAQNALNLLYWNEVLGTYGEVYFWIRTGDTPATIAAASWNGPYTTPAGSDISAVTPAKYIQFKCKMYVKNADAAVSEAPNIYLERGAVRDYVVRVSLGSGVLSESTIPLEYESQWLDFGWIDPRLRNRRKRVHSARIEFERVKTTGSFTFGYRLDTAAEADRVDATFNWADVAARGFAIYRFPINSTICRNLKYRLYDDSDVHSVKFKRVILRMSILSDNALL